MARRHRATEISWQAKTAVLAWMDKNGQTEIHEQIQKMARSGMTRKTAFEVVSDPRKKAAMIGIKIQRHGVAKVAKAFKSEMDWLNSQGMTPEQAVEAWREMDAAERNHPFWSK